MVESDPVLAQLVSPVRERISEIETEIAELERQLTQKRSELRPYRRILVAANGQKPGPKSKAKQGTGRIGRDYVREVDEQIRMRFSDGTEFTATDVYRGWQPEARRIGSDKAIHAVRELHAAGVIRLMRRGKGGSTIYRVVDQ